MLAHLQKPLAGRPSSEVWLQDLGAPDAEGRNRSVLVAAALLFSAIFVAVVTAALI